MLITIAEDPSRGFQHQPLGHTASAPLMREAAPIESDSRRIRSIKLKRPPAGSYGFHLRGGREHGTGFFISHVEEGSEAHIKGLKTGDQVLKVNYLSVGRALHKEVASIVQNNNEIILEVKSAGIIPVKNNANDPLSWVLVNEKEQKPQTAQQIPKFFQQGPNAFPQCVTPVHIVMNGAGKYAIGCSICKGPAEKPGIFVQRVRDGGVAAASGLRAGDQILSCNGMSFLYMEFQQAVQILKSTGTIRLEVLRGAGIELITGESSGYNSSASSETGEEHYPSSEGETRDCYPNTLVSNISNRLNTVPRPHQLPLDLSRDWKEIEAEWEEAEVSEKRSQLEHSHTLLSNRKSAPVGIGMAPTKSLLNLTIREDESERNICIPYTEEHRKTSNSTAGTATSGISKLTNKHRSLSDLHLGRDPSGYKIALQTATESHVSKIVIPSAPKNEQNALLRLDELSSPSNSLRPLPKYSTKPNSQLFQSHSKTCSLSSSSSEDFSPEGEKTFAQIRRRQEESRSYLKETNLPESCCLDSLTTSEDSDSLLNYPTSRICITSDNGRFTSKVIIRSPPPAPPPRANNTKLSRQQRKLRCPHRHTKAFTNTFLKVGSPPPSPSTSNDSSNEGFACNGHSHLARHKSFGSLSVSSEESISPWDDTVESSLSSHCSIQVASSVESKNSTVLRSKQSTLTVGEARKTVTTSSKTESVKSIPIPPPLPSSNSNNTNSITTKPGAPPPPPPPPAPLLNGSVTASASSAAMSLGAAINKELKSRQEQDGMGAISKLKSPTERPERILKEVPIDPKKQQHEKLMEEFKKAHALMFSKKKDSQQETTEESEISRL